MLFRSGRVKHEVHYKGDPVFCVECAYRQTCTRHEGREVTADMGCLDGRKVSTLPVDDTQKRRKYNNVKKAIDGITFDSKAEADRYGTLKLLLAAGKIRSLKCHVPYLIHVEMNLVCTYEADFVYEEKTACGWEWVVEDCKGVRTAVYKLKKKLMAICRGIVIREVEAK